MLRDVWVQGEPGGGHRSSGSVVGLGAPVVAVPASCGSRGGESVAFPSHGTGVHPTCFVGRAANYWGGLALGERLLRFKGEKISTHGRRNENLSP